MRSRAIPPLALILLLGVLAAPEAQSLRKVGEMELSLVGLSATVDGARTAIPGLAMATRTALLGSSAQLPTAARLEIVHLNPTPVDRLNTCAQALGRKPLLYSVDARWPTSSEACPRSDADFSRLMARMLLTVVPAGEWEFVYPTWWVTQPVLSPPSWRELTVSQSVREWSFDGRRGLAASELSEIAAVVKSVARPPMIADHPLGKEGGQPREGIALQLLIDVLEMKKGVESIVAVYGEPCGLGRIVYGEFAGGRFVPHWDSPLLTTDVAFNLSYHDFDGDGVLEVVGTGREGRDGWTFTAFDTRGREITRQPVCEPGSWYLGPGDPGVEGGSTCSIQGHVDGPIELEKNADGTTELVGSVWYMARSGPALGSVRFKLIDGLYVRDPKYPAVVR